MKGADNRPMLTPGAYLHTNGMMVFTFASIRSVNGPSRGACSVTALAGCVRLRLSSSRCTFPACLRNAKPPVAFPI